MAFYHQAHPWNPGYAVPKYVLAEPPGRGTFTTKQLPRRTISQVIPDYLAMPTKAAHSLSGSSLSGSTLSGSSLGDSTYKLEPLGATGRAKSPDDYGHKSAAWIMAQAKRLPAGQRARAVKALLASIDPKLPDQVAAHASKLKDKGLPANVALQRAMAFCLSRGISKEIVSMGKGGRSVPRPFDLSGDVEDSAISYLTSHPKADATKQSFWPGLRGGAKALWGYRQARTGVADANKKLLQYLKGSTSGFTAGEMTSLYIGNYPDKNFSDREFFKALPSSWRSGWYYNLKFGVRQANKVLLDHMLKRTSPGLLDYGKAIVETVYSGVKTSVELVVETPEFIAKLPGKTVDFVKDGLSILSDAACELVSGTTGVIAGGTAATIAGASPQVGVAGAQIAQGICGQATAPPPVYEEEKGLPGWVLPVAIGGGALVLLVALRK